ncbi:MAG: N-acetyltransferase [Hyphomicrobiales bacterium]|nr:N-acetyltransferase [Hyphomicrobiales bacterium]MBV9738884.1 N-acetyltransferase [Hyphomicrobiales bacterium]
MPAGSSKAASPSEFALRAASSFAKIDAASWDACANPPAAGLSGKPRGSCDDDPFNPFVSHAFLSALEESKSAVARAGWSPCPLLVEDVAGELVACAPTYLKSHSMGEYVFDHAFADAFARAGGRYYPKLQVAVPFTPVTGKRLLVRNGPEIEKARESLIGGLASLMRQAGASSTHVTFASRADWDALASFGFLKRLDRQFHWLNAGYQTFNDFLGALASRKRKVIRRERREALRNGIAIEWVSGSDITEAHLDAFFAFYMDTGSRKWGRPYLTRPFFSLLAEKMRERLLFIMAKRAGRHVAGAINLIGDLALYGRNWGCIEDHPFLHFEVCYYQAIEFAIARKLARVEAGAQGEHKLARGYVPVETHSAHLFADPRLARAVADYLDHERHYVEIGNRELAEAVPFRRAEPERED